MVISLLILSISDWSLILSFSKILIATLSPVTMCVPYLTLPNVPLPFVLPIINPPIFLPSLFFSFSSVSSRSPSKSAGGGFVAFFPPFLIVGLTSMAFVWSLLSLSYSVLLYSALLLLFAGVAFMCEMFLL